MSQILLRRAPFPSVSARPAAAASAGQSYRLGVWIMIATLGPLIGFLGARGYAPLVGLAGVLCLPLVRPRTADLAGLILFGLLVEWAMISFSWSPAPRLHTTKDLLRFTGLHLAQQLVFSGALVIAARTLEPRIARRAFVWLGGGLLFLAGVLLCESLTDAFLLRTVQDLTGQRSPPITHWALRTASQGGYALAVLVWPVALALLADGRRVLTAALALLCLADLALLHMAAPLLALAISVGVFALVLRGGRAAALGCMTAAALQTLLLPWLMLAGTAGGLLERMRPRLPASWAARVDIWAFASARMREKPLFGWGLDASRTFKDHIPLHPHDGPLQLWLELGAIGAILGSLAWAYVFWRFAEMAARNRLLAAAGCAVAAVCLVIGDVSFGLWQEWWICLMALGFAACVVLGRRLDGAPERPRD